LEKKIVILGLGPCGLGAANRLTELKYTNFKVFERHAYPGGLATSFTDDAGFTWDIGGHVMFSHYKYFDDLMDNLLRNEWLTHERESWIWIKDRFVPYPFQNNIRHLPKEDLLNCLKTLPRIDQNNKEPKNFRDWIYMSFGKGIAEQFMMPYNYKVWAYAPEKMSFKWIGERVAVIDTERIKNNIQNKRDDVSWGPNNNFKFPLKGGTGEIWKRLYQKLQKEKVNFNYDAITIDTNKKIVNFSNEHKENYDILISTLPLDRLLFMSGLKDKSAVGKLLHSSTHVIGLGLKGKPDDTLKTKCWMYFPENNCPFYRVTVLSNYSFNTVPDINKYWSLMFEVSESPDKSVNRKTIIEDTIKGALATKLIKSANDVVDTWHHFEEYGYPTPSLERDEALDVLKEIDMKDIFSRGRFGAWKYEVGNMDHSLMQGVEVVNRILKKEDEVTVWKPEVVNKK
jgi:protoporphyrinogen oxidase